MIAASISSGFWVSNEYHSSIIGLSRGNRRAVGNIDAYLLYNGAISNIGIVGEDKDCAVAYISRIGVAKRSISVIGIDSLGYEFGEVG